MKYIFVQTVTDFYKKNLDFWNDPGVIKVDISNLAYEVFSIHFGTFVKKKLTTIRVSVGSVSSKTSSSGTNIGYKISRFFGNKPTI